MKLNGDEILCFANSRNVQPRCCRVRVLEPIEIPPESEMIVPGYTKGVINKTYIGLLEADTKFLHTKGLLVAKALVCPTTGTVPVRTANPYAQSCKLYKNTVVATYEPIEPEQLVFVNTTQSNDTLTDPCNERELPEHLKELYSKRFKPAKFLRAVSPEKLAHGLSETVLERFPWQGVVHCLNTISI